MLIRKVLLATKMENSLDIYVYLSDAMNTKKREEEKSFHVKLSRSALPRSSNIIQSASQCFSPSSPMSKEFLNFPSDLVARSTETDKSRRKSRVNSIYAIMLRPSLVCLYKSIFAVRLFIHSISVCQ